jgi:hypothetical protein
MQVPISPQNEQLLPTTVLLSLVAALPLLLIATNHQIHQPVLLSSNTPLALAARSQITLLALVVVASTCPWRHPISI